MVEAFNTDEGEFLWALHLCMERGDFALDRTEYGMLYYNIGLAIAKVFGLFVEVNDTLILYIFRALSLSFTIGTAIICARMVQLFAGKAVAIFAFGVCLLGSVVILNYGTMLHPDNAQMFFLALSLYFSMRAAIESSKTYLWLAAASAGLAFSTKYAGIALAPIFVLLAAHLAAPASGSSNRLKAESFLVLILAIPLFIVFDADRLFASMGSPEQKDHELFLLFRLMRLGSIVAFLSGVLGFVIQNRRVGVWLRFVSLNMGVVFIFLLGFYLGSPQFISARGFVEGFLYVTDLHRYGHWFADSRGALAWLQIFLGETILQQGVSVMLLLLLTLSVAVPVAAKSRGQVLAALLPWIWFFLFLFTLLSRVSSKFPHYLIPVWPSVVVLAGLGGFVLRERFKWVALFGAFGLLIVGFWNNLNYRDERIQEVALSDAMKAGEWMAINLSSPLKVLSDKYAYVPAVYGWQYESVWQLTPQMIDEKKPEILVITEKIWSRFSAPQSAGFLKGEDLYSTRRDMYEALLSNRYESYELQADFGRVKVFSRKTEIP
jgi:hypothetical protein